VIWWGWVIIGVIFLFGEVLTLGSFYLIFFGIAGIVTGSITYFVSQLELWQQILIFSLLSVGLITVLRRRMIQKIVSKESYSNDLIGRELTLQQTLRPEEGAYAKILGSSWQLVNGEEFEIINSGERAEVVDRVGLSLIIKKKRE
jgi:hypothetical protein